MNRNSTGGIEKAGHDGRDHLCFHNQPGAQADSKPVSGIQITVSAIILILRVHPAEVMDQPISALLKKPNQALTDDPFALRPRIVFWRRSLQAVRRRSSCAAHGRKDIACEK
jgi:hypothetical protein